MHVIGRLLARFLRAQQSGLALVILALGVLLTVAGAYVSQATGQRVNPFLNSHTLVQVATDASFFAIMAIGMTMVIISGGIDLSVGSIYSLSAVTMAITLNVLGTTEPAQSLVLALVLCLGIGLLCGLANGLMVVRLR